jgi:hypothetical protein
MQSRKHLAWHRSPGAAAALRALAVVLASGLAPPTAPTRPSTGGSPSMR